MNCPSCKKDMKECPHSSREMKNKTVIPGFTVAYCKGWIPMKQSNGDIILQLYECKKCEILMNENGVWWRLS